MNSFHQLEVSLVMAWMRISLLLLIVLIGQSVADDIRSLEMSIMTDLQFQCASTTCLPFATVTTSDIRNCQMACLAAGQCQAASFQQLSSSCELFTNMQNQNNNLSTDLDTVTMIVIFGTRIPPPEPRTTSTTASTTTLLTTTSRTSTTPTITTTTTTSTTTTITTTTTTSTTTTSTTTTTSRTTTSSSSTTSTTTTAIPCSSVCVNTTTSTTGSLLALYLFESSATDYTSTYNATAAGSPTYSSGYVGNAIKLVSSSSQSLTLPSALTFTNRSTTVELWLNLQSPLYITSTATEVSIISQCPTGSTDRCLFYTIRSHVLYQGFGYDDKGGTTNISTFLGQWIHVAFTYDLTTRLRQIYLNGIPEPTGYTSGLTAALEGGPFIGTGAQATIGRNTLLNTPYNYLNGYVDHFSISNRAKSPCEILNDATLVVYYSFDSGSLVDTGPNMLTGTAAGQTTTTGQRNQALSFTGNGATSYFQTGGLTALGTVNSAFSIGLYIKPAVLHGSIVHVSATATGAGGWCLPFIGFTSSQYLAVQVWNNSFSVYALGPIVTMNTWTHVVETFSVRNGLKLYVNGTLYSSIFNISTYSASGVQNYLTIASTLTASISPQDCSSTGVLGLGSYNGSVDELRVYSRELTAEDVCTLSRY